MKRVIQLAVILLSFISFRSFAQVPQITLGIIPANSVKDGKMEITKTTKAEILQNTKLTGNDKYCTISGYTFSISAGNTHWSVTVKGDELTPQIIKKIKKTKGPGVNLFFDNIHILYDGNVASTNPVLLTFDQ